VGTSEDGEESSSVPDEEDDVQAIIELLSSVQSPQVSEITSRSALLKWTEPPAPTAADNIIYNSRDLRYEVLLSDRGKEGKYKSIFKGPSLSCRIQDLRPGQEYSVCLQVHLEELQGSASEPAVFLTPPCEPDQPFPPKLIQRTKNSLQLRWNAPTDNGSHIIHYILESNMGKAGDFVEVIKMKSKQYTLTKLESSTMYAFRLAAVNEIGRSQYSDVVTHSTSCNPPQQPQSPMLQNTTSSSLRLAWQRQSRDEEYTLQMADREYGSGYFNMYTGRDNIYECTNLRRATGFCFRLKAENEAGQSPWSDEVTFRTQPERPGQPPKPAVKGKIHANWFKVKWEAPVNRGGADIKMYYLEISYGAGFTRVYAGPDCEANCEHLNPGTTYQVRVICEGPGGTSMCSEPCTVTTDAVVPNAPQQPCCGNPPGPYAAVLRWERPIYNGGAPVTEYELELENVATQQRLLAYKGREAYGVVKDLLPGELYRVHVRALNRIGAGPWSDEYQFKAGAAPPFSPTNLDAAVRSPTHLTVSWQEPRNNGAPITEYRLESAAMEEKDELFICTYTGVATQTEVRNLTPFTTYFFRVSATNPAGSSPISQTILQKTPAAAPASPQLQDWEVSANDLTINWLTPESNGAVVLYYVIECGDRLISTEGLTTEVATALICSNNTNLETTTSDTTDSSSSSTTTTTPTTITTINTTNTLFIDKLSPESTYKLRIKAVNNIGSGPFSNFIKIQTLPLPPPPPKLECYQSGYNFLKLRWGDGKNLDFQRYYVEMQHGRSKEFQNVYAGTRNTCKVQKLHEMTTYVFRIYAETDRAGTGDYSADFEFATIPALPNTIKAPRVAVTPTTTTSVNSTTTILEDEQQQNRVTIEWQQSKNNPFQDPINYLLQWSTRGSASKEQDFKEVSTKIK
jgi:fibronectin type III domain-containing protein 3